MTVKKNIQRIFKLLSIILLIGLTAPAYAVEGLTGKAEANFGEEARTVTFYLVKDALRIEFSTPVRGFNGYVDTMIVYADGKFYSIDAKTGQAYVTKTGKQNKQNKQTSVLHVSALEEICGSPNTTCETLGEKTIAGRSAQGHKIVAPDGASIVWIDKETGYALVGKEKENGKFATEWKVIEAQAENISRDKFIVSNAKENKGMQKLMNSLKGLKERLKQQRQEAMQGG